MTDKVIVLKLVVTNHNYLVSFKFKDEIMTYKLNQDMIVHFDLYQSKIIDYEVLSRIKSTSDMIKLLKQIQVKLAIKRMTNCEVKIFLCKHCDDQVVVQEILTVLKNQKLIDDDAYATALCNDAIIKKKGLLYCLQVAKEKGLDLELVRIAYEPFLEQEQDIILNSIEKMMRLNYSKTQIISKLVYNGFKLDDIKAKLVDFNADFVISEKEFLKIIKRYQKYNDFEKKQKVLNYFISKGYNKEDIKNAYDMYEKE